MARLFIIITSSHRLDIASVAERVVKPQSLTHSPYVFILDAPKGQPTVYITPQQVYIDEEVTFKCDTSNIEAPVKWYYWFKDGHFTKSVTDNSTWTWNIGGISDSGNYSCQAGNSVGNSSISGSMSLSVVPGNNIIHNMTNYKFSLNYLLILGKL